MPLKFFGNLPGTGMASRKVTGKSQMYYKTKKKIREEATSQWRRRRQRPLNKDSIFH